LLVKYEYNVECMQVGASSPIILLDADGTVAPTAAREVAAASAEREAVSFVSGGAAAWQAADLPWKAPGQFGLNFDGLKNLFGGNSAPTEEASAAASEVKTTVSGVLPGLLQFRDLWCNFNMLSAGRMFLGAPHAKKIGNQNSNNGSQHRGLR
jgi:hypothetical protein